MICLCDFLERACKESRSPWEDCARACGSVELSDESGCEASVVRYSSALGSAAVRGEVDDGPGGESNS